MVKSWVDGEVVPPDDSESEREVSYVIILCIYGYHCILLIQSNLDYPNTIVHKNLF